MIREEEEEVGDTAEIDVVVSEYEEKMGRGRSVCGDNGPFLLQALSREWACFPPLGGGPPNPFVLSPEAKYTFPRVLLGRASNISHP